MRFFGTIILYWAITLPLCAQSTAKFEREQRLTTDRVPPAAQAFLADCQPQAKISWYKEQSQDGLSIEAKTKYEGVRYSIEFDTLGQVEDVEVLTSFPDLPTTVQDSICHQLQQEYGRFRLMRVQRQWTAAAPATLQALIRSGSSSGPYQERYELVIKARTTTGTEWFEYLFHPTGEVLRKQRIVFRNTDNLDY
jgi:hypothetical protein